MPISSTSSSAELLPVIQSTYTPPPATSIVVNRASVSAGIQATPADTRTATMIPPQAAATAIAQKRWGASLRGSIQASEVERRSDDWNQNANGKYAPSNVAQNAVETRDPR